MTRPPFVMKPSALIYSEVSSDAAKLWEILDDLCRSKPSIEISQSQLATLLATSVRTLQRRIAELRAADWLEVHRGRRIDALYVPLNRARPVDNQQLRTATDGGSYTLKNRQSWRVLESPHSSLHTREEAQGQTSSVLVHNQADAARLAWCGQCDEHDRTLEEIDERGYPRIRTCSACHPSLIAPWDR